MTNKEIKKRLLKAMKKDNDLKPYVKDIKELNQKSFGILVRYLTKVNNQYEWNNNNNIRLFGYGLFSMAAR